MSRTFKLKNPDGSDGGKLTVPDDATDEQIRAAMLRLKAHREKQAPAAPTPDPLDEKVRCIVCRPGSPLVPRRELATHMVQHNTELEELASDLIAPSRLVP